MKFASRTLSAFFAAALLISTAFAADKQPQAPSAPFPPEIAAAKTVFLSYAGTECAPSDYRYSGTRDRAFNQFYVAAKSKLPYQVVTSPANADLVLEFSMTCGPPSGVSAVAINFILRIYSSKEGVTLWTFTEPVKQSGMSLQKSRDEGFDLALTSLVDDAYRAASTTPPTQ